MNKKAIIFSVAISLLVVLALFVLPAVPDQVNAQEGNIEDGAVKGWLWSSNIGWIKTDSNESNPVKIASDGNWGGYAWSSSVGWIDFGPSGSYPQAPNHGVKTDGSNVIGWARACSVFASGCSGTLKPESSLGGWDGWIKMSNVTYDKTAGKLSGFSWGNLNLGWIGFNFDESGSGTPGCTIIPTVDTNCDGTNDCGTNCGGNCVINCGGGGPTVSCTANPPSARVGDQIIYSAIVSDSSATAYIWTGGTGSHAQGSTFINTFETSYNTAGNYFVSVKAYNGSVLIGEAQCNGTVGVNITDDGEEEDIPCAFSFGASPSSISLTFINPVFDRYYTSRPNNSLKVTLDPVNCTSLSLMSGDFPSGSEMVCSIDGGTTWKEGDEGCNNLFGSSIMVGVKAKSNEIDETELTSGCKKVTIKNSGDENNSKKRDVCFNGTFGN